MANSKILFPTNLTELNPMFTSTYTNGVSFINPQKNINTNAAAFETKNGESIAVFYNPYCISDLGFISYNGDEVESSATYTRKSYVQPFMCANFIYDLNGLKGPNKVGKDLGFITAIYPTDSEIVAPMLANNIEVVGIYNQLNSLCRAKNPESRTPNTLEIFALFYNRPLLFEQTGSYYFQTPQASSPYRSWTIPFHSGIIVDYVINEAHKARCVKR